MTSRRPPSSAGGGSRPPTANRPTTSNRPRTGRPTTGRPTTAAGNQNQNQQGLVVDQFAAAGGAGSYWQEEIDEEEYYESDDEDVFAFVARELTNLEEKGCRVRKCSLSRVEGRAKRFSRLVDREFRERQSFSLSLFCFRHSLEKLISALMIVLLTSQILSSL